MTQEPNHPDPIDHALAALRSAAPPAGMEDRILQRLDARAAIHQPTSALRSAWFRGAITGALAAITACAALFFVLHTHHATAPQTIAAAIAQSAPAATPVAVNTSSLCNGPTDSGRSHPSGAWMTRTNMTTGVPQTSRSLMRDDWENRTSHRSAHLLPASFAPSHPAPPAPLTAQERALAELVRKANPAMLAALSPAAQQKADAKRQADFDAFFAPSADIRAVDEEQKKALGISDDEPTTPNSTKEGSL